MRCKVTFCERTKIYLRDLTVIYCHFPQTLFCDIFLEFFVVVKCEGSSVKGLRNLDRIYLDSINGQKFIAPPFVYVERMNKSEYCLYIGQPFMQQ